jgi:hypothetical protein
MPKLETVLIENNTLTPQGGGEPPIITVGATLANAVFHATGARLNRLPMTPERVVTAMGQASMLTLDPPVRVSNQLRLSWKGRPGIRLQQSATLTNPGWQDVPGSDGVSQLDLPLDAAGAFFRLIKP